MTHSSTDRGAVVLLGASGFLGNNLRQLASLSLGHTWIPVNRKPDESRGEIAFAEWEDHVKRLMKRGVIPTVINCVALADVVACERNPTEAWHINVELAVRIGHACRDYGIRLVHISSDGLFANEDSRANPHYWDKDASPKPVTVYGKTKLAAEQGLEKLGWGHCVRLSFVGPSLGTSRGLIAFLAQAIVFNRPDIDGFADVWFTPLHAVHVYQSIERLLEARHPDGFKLHHWASRPAITKSDFIDAVLRSIDAKIQVRRIERSGSTAPPIPLDQSLKSDIDISLEDVLKLSVSSLHEQLKTLAAERAKA